MSWTDVGTNSFSDFGSRNPEQDASGRMIDSDAKYLFILLISNHLESNINTE